MLRHRLQAEIGLPGTGYFIVALVDRQNLMQRSVSPSGLNIFNEVPMAIPAVQLLADRSLEQKQALIKAVTNVTCLTPGSSPESGHIIIQDVKRDDWATGAKPRSDQG